MSNLIDENGYDLSPINTYLKSLDYPLEVVAVYRKSDGSIATENVDDLMDNFSFHQENNDTFLGIYLR